MSPSADPWREIRSAVAGTTIGSGIVLYAQNMPDTDNFKPWLLVTVPLIAILATYGSRSSQDWWSARRHRNEPKSFYKRAKKTFTAALLDPNTSPEHKVVIRQQIEEIEKLYLQSIRSEAQRILVTTEQQPVPPAVVPEERPQQ